MADEMKLTFPTIHLNGSSPDTLLEDYESAINAIQLAVDVLSANRPHARDYYPQGDEAFANATNEHLTRIYRLRVVRDELQLIHNNISEQREQRRARR